MNFPESIQEWVTKAEADFETAVTMADKKVHDVVGFHCQQCIEKYLKSFLSFNKLHFPKTHDLLELLELALPSHTKNNEKIKKLFSRSIENPIMK